MNDIESAVPCKLFLFADDSVLVTSGKDILERERLYVASYQKFNHG